jgi:predicted glycosyltransferase involved in capsule biosynthesis
MDKNQKILDEVKKTISLLDRVKNIESNPFLYTRIMARLDAEVNKQISSSKEFTFKVLRQVVFALLFLFNAYSVITYLSDGSEDELARQTYIKNIISEYSLDAESEYVKYYDKD